jgi:hypothetical protein
MIKILRLSDSGIEIIATIEETSPEEFQLKDPMRLGFVTGQSGKMYLQLFQLLPLSIYKDRDVVLPKNQIMYIAEPSEMMLEYYVEQIQKLDAAIKEFPGRNFAEFQSLQSMQNDIDGVEEVIPSPTTPSKKFN